MLKCLLLRLDVHPAYEPSKVFECKYELDSLAHFLALSSTFYNNTQSTNFLTPRWYTALDTVMSVIDAQSQSTFDPTTGRFWKNEYTFRRRTDQGTETLPLSGVGNPLNSGTGLVRSAFRYLNLFLLSDTIGVADKNFTISPSDDATILQFLIPANAQMAVELKKIAGVLRVAGKSVLAQRLEKRAQVITDGIWEHGIVNHKKYGEVFAFETDGYGSHIIMDDANVPSLLALPILGFVGQDDPVYMNTRKMILEQAGNPYYLQGKEFKGIGGKF